MASVNNSYLVSLLGLCMTSQVMLVSQLLPLGSLLDYVKKNSKRIQSRTFLNWCSQIAKVFTPIFPQFFFFDMCVRIGNEIFGRSPYDSS